MTIKEYAEAISIELGYVLGKTVELISSKKINGIVHYGVAIDENETSKVAFYINEFYNDNDNIEDVVKTICIWYYKFVKPNKSNYSWITNYESVKGRLFYKLVNKEANAFLIDKCVCEEYLDLLKIYSIYVESGDNEQGKGTCLVEKAFLNFWGVDEETLKQDAESNAEKLLPVKMSKLQDAMKEILARNDTNEMDDIIIEDLGEDSMWVLTNNEGFHGAACMCYNNQIKDFADLMNRDMIIIPSSLHEIILVPSYEEIDLENMKELVYEVNRTLVGENEYLSDNIYIYKRKTGMIEII